MYAAGFRSTQPVSSRVVVPQLPPQVYMVAGGVLLPLVVAKFFPESVAATQQSFENNRTAYAVQHPYAYGWFSSIQNLKAMRFANNGTNADRHQAELDAAWARYQDLLKAFEVQPLLNEDRSDYTARMSLLSAQLYLAARSVEAAASLGRGALGVQMAAATGSSTEARLALIEDINRRAPELNCTGLDFKTMAEDVRKLLQRTVDEMNQASGSRLAELEDKLSRGKQLWKDLEEFGGWVPQYPKPMGQYFVYRHISSVERFDIRLEFGARATEAHWARSDLQRLHERAKRADRLKDLQILFDTADAFVTDGGAAHAGMVANNIEFYLNLPEKFTLQEQAKWAVYRDFVQNPAVRGVDGSFNLDCPGERFLQEPVDSVDLYNGEL